MKMNNIKDLFETLEKNESFRKLKLDSCPINVYYGKREHGMPSISFMTDTPPMIIDSTQYITVNQWRESEHVYWSSFDLQLLNARTVFYSLCLDFIRTASNCENSHSAMQAIKNRYLVWRKIFSKMNASMSQELYKGLFGELYFLLNYLVPKYGISAAVKAWSGANNTSKDCSISQTWYEIKTTSLNSSAITISSIAQLDSDVPGHLVVIKTEEMSKEYDDGFCMVDQLLSKLLDLIDDNDLRDELINKVMSYGYDVNEDNVIFPHFRVANKAMYYVDDSFPRITSNNVPYNEIVRLTYSLSLVGLSKYMEGSNDIDW